MTAPVPVVENKVAERATVRGVVAKPPAATTFPAGTVLGFKWLAAIFRPAPFIAGALIGFVLCCYLGYLTTTKNQFGDIQRFGIYVGPQASFYPTVSQLLAVIKSRLKPDQTLVLVGGSSILNGVGQSNEELWTKRLQEHLGPKYCVVNFALRSCNSYEGAYFVAEALQKQGTKIIFVTSALPSTIWHPMGNPPYAYMYWDAKYHNLLYDYPARENAILSREKELPDQEWKPEELTELKLQQALNSQFHFLELWNTVGYRYFFTSFRSVTDHMSFWPRKKLPNNAEAYEAFPMPDEKFAKSYFPSVLARLYIWDANKKTWVKEPEFWKLADDTITNNVVPQMRPHTLALLLYQNGDMRRKYETPLELQRDKLVFNTAESSLKKFGIHALQCGENWVDADFRDAMHLGATGGYKLAAQTADEVRKMAKELGYDK